MAWENSTLIGGDVAARLSELKRRPGRNITVSGSPTLVRSLLRDDVLDELQLLVHPVVLGRGARLFGENGDGTQQEERGRAKFGYTYNPPMKLNVHERGDGDKVALLIHGGMSDHRTWHAVEDDLVARGYRVIAPDLRGHGLSPRGAYGPEHLGDDLADSLPQGADVAIGHSLGGLSLSLAVERLLPKKAVYSDPGFRLGDVPAEALAFMRQMVKTSTAESVRQMNPRWSQADIEAELAGFALFDADFFTGIEGVEADYLPARPVVPSLVQLGDPSFTINEAAAALLRERGFEVRVVKGAGHCIHRDDFPAFMASLEGWI